MSEEDTKYKKPSKGGPIMCIIGALLLFMGGASFYGLLYMIEDIIYDYGESWSSLGVDPTLLQIKTGVTLLLGLGALLGALIIFRNRIIGGYLCVFVGAITLIGAFVPIGQIDLRSIGEGVYPVTLNGWGLLVDPFLIIIGGIWSIYSPETTHSYKKAKQQKELRVQVEKKYGEHIETVDADDINWEKERKKQKELKLRLGTNY